MQLLCLKAALILDNTTVLKFSSQVSNLSQWSQIPFFNLESQHFCKISSFKSIYSLHKLPPTLPYLQSNIPKTSIFHSTRLKC